MNPKAKQGTLDSFVKKSGGSPRAHKVQSGPTLHAAASKVVRHSPISRGEGSGGMGVHTGSHTGTYEHTTSTQQSADTATSCSHLQSFVTGSLKAQTATSRNDCILHCYVVYFTVMLYTSLLCSIIPLVSLIFAILVSLHPATFLITCIRMKSTSCQRRCMSNKLFL